VRSCYLRIYYIIIVCCTIFSNNVKSQAQNDNVLRPGTHYIKSDKLIGTWVCVDPSKNAIEFVDSSYQFVLLDSCNHPYYFFMDSLRNVFSSGYYPNWPPYNCDLNFISADTLQATYTVMGSGDCYMYVRKKQRY
jgi:hypothetical protein